MTVLAETPADGKNVTSLITTIPPCYCSQAVDYGNIFDVYTTWQRNTAVADNKPHTEGSATSIVAGFMSVSNACLSDACKGMMRSFFDFFAGITVPTSSVCTAENALKCLADAGASECPDPPTQGRWIGAIADDMGDDIQATHAIPTGSTSEAGSGDSENGWRDLFWSACNMRYTCPDVGTSAYVIKTLLTVADANDVDTPAKIATLIGKFVQWINEKAGAKILTTAMVTATVANRRRGRSLAAATVTFSIDTTNELAKQQIIQATDSDSTTTAELETSLGVAVSEAFTTSEVSTVTYPPPPPAPGYKDNIGKQGDVDGDGDGDGDGLALPLIIGIVVGSSAFVACLVALVCLVMHKRQRKPVAI